MASWVLEHQRQPAADLAEIGRVLKPGGHFIFLTPNRGHPLIQLNRLLGRISALQTRLVSRLYARQPDDTFPAYYRANCQADIERLAGAAGLQLVALHIIADPSYWGVMPALYPTLSRLDAHLPTPYQLHLVGCLNRPA